MNRKSIYPIKVRQIYDGMKRRCYLKEGKDYPNYGGRGVVVCDEWLNNRDSFFNWAVNNGWEEGLQLDKDIKGNGLLYSPETCCFVTPTVNHRHKRNIKRYLFNNEYLTLTEISERTGIFTKTLWQRIYTYKMPFDRAVTKQTHKIN